MRILQLGNGGGLDPQMTNSSFLIEYKNNDEIEYLLFDCGFNIMARLLELKINISKIKYVFISHIHDDHVGNLETLIFWNYFKNNVCTKILGSADNSEVYKYIESKHNSILSGSQVVNKKIFNYNVIHDFKYISDDIRVYPIIGYHGSNQSNGLIIKDIENDEYIFISGDTKASESIQEKVETIIPFDGEYISFKLFHDFSLWNAPSENVHACENDINVEYSEEFKNSLNYYHTGLDNFNKDWQEITV